MTIQPCADLLARDVSVFEGSTNTTPIETVPLADVLRRIQDGTYRPAVASLRHLLATGNQTRYRREKEKSLAFTPCCALHTRAKDVDWPEKLLSTTGLVHFDLDHLDDPDAVKRQLARDDHIAFAFVSPSGQGLKIGVAARGITGPEDYKHAWAVVLDALNRAGAIYRPGGFAMRTGAEVSPEIRRLARNRGAEARISRLHFFGQATSVKPQLASAAAFRRPAS
jgi:hypothetical protein